MIFTLLPVLILACAQLVVALLLLAPGGLALPAVKLCKLSQSSVGQTCLATVSVFLVVLLIPPILDLQDLRAQTRAKYNIGTANGELSNLHRRESEALAYMSTLLTVFCLVMNFAIRKLGLTVSKLELAQLKETTLLKQVKGLHAEYDRMSSQPKGKETRENSSASLQASIAAAKTEIDSLQEKLSVAEKKRKNAELNMDALKTQTKGLENEYDRLMATNDELQKKLSRLDPKFESSSDQRGWKKDW